MSTRTIIGEAPTPRARLASPRRLLRLPSDAALAERYAEGDEGAFAVLFERHRASVLAVCIGVLSAPHDAEDAAQESFAALAVALRTSPPRDLRAWLVRVARNAAIDVARRRKLRVCIDSEAAEVAGPAVDDVAASQSVKHELESVLAGIRELPESQRTVLLMRELAGHSYVEIAALLDLDEDAVRGLIARARIGLRQHREAAELPCAAARAEIVSEPDGRRHSKTVRRHVRGCAACRSYRRALRDDAKALKGLVPVHAGSVAGGGALFGGLAAKGALLGAGVAQMTAACAVSVCAVGGIVLLTPGGAGHHHGGGTGSASGGARAGTVARARSTAASASRGRTAAFAPGSSGSPLAAGATAPASSLKGAVSGRATGRYQGSRATVLARLTTHGSVLGSTLGSTGRSDASGAGERPPVSSAPGAGTASHPGGMAPANGEAIASGSGIQPSGNPGPSGSGSGASGPSDSGSGSSAGGAGASATGSTPAGMGGGGMQASLGGTPGSWPPGGSGGSGSGSNSGSSGSTSGGGSSAGSGIPPS